jgi:hypothetical protein
MIRSYYDTIYNIVLFAYTYKRMIWNYVHKYYHKTYLFTVYHNIIFIIFIPWNINIIIWSDHIMTPFIVYITIILSYCLLINTSEWYEINSVSIIIKHVYLLFITILYYETIYSIYCDYNIILFAYKYRRMIWNYYSIYYDYNIILFPYKYKQMIWN